MSCETTLISCWTNRHIFTKTHGWTWTFNAGIDCVFHHLPILPCLITSTCIHDSCVMRIDPRRWSDDVGQSVPLQGQVGLLRHCVIMVVRAGFCELLSSVGVTAAFFLHCCEYSIVDLLWAQKFYLVVRVCDVGCYGWSMWLWAGHGGGVCDCGLVIILLMISWTTILNIIEFVDIVSL